MIKAWVEMDPEKFLLYALALTNGDFAAGQRTVSLAYTPVVIPTFAEGQECSAS